MPKDRQGRTVQSFAEMKYHGMDGAAKTVMGQKNDYCVAPGNTDLLTNELSASRLIYIL